MHDEGGRCGQLDDLAAVTDEIRRVVHLTVGVVHEDLGVRVLAGACGVVGEVADGLAHDDGAAAVLPPFPHCAVQSILGERASVLGVW